MAGCRARPVHHDPRRQRKTMIADDRRGALGARGSNIRHAPEAAVIALSIVAFGCRAPRRPELRAVALPELARAAPSVRAQLGERYAALTRTSTDPAASPGDLAQAYGA